MAGSGGTGKDSLDYCLFDHLLLVKYSKGYHMKKTLLFVAILSFIVVIATIELSSGKSKANSKSRMLTVSDVQANPNAYKGSIIITGVVARFSKEDPKLFAIIDTAEAKHCKSLGCAKFSLPIKYEKTMPKEWDEINATGQFVEKGGLLFEATNVEILRHLKF